MILYNVTVNVDEQVQEDWVDWMSRIHIPEVMNTGKFVEYKFTKLLTGEQEGGVTYAIQYLCPDMETFQEYEEEHAPRLQQDHLDKFEGRFGAFRTLMEVVEGTGLDIGN